MQSTLIAGQTESVIGVPYNGLTPPTPSPATLSSAVYTSSDPTVFTVAVDPSTPNGAILTAVGSALSVTVQSVSATLTETALATEPDGTTTETIQGVATITVTAAPPPPPPVAASLVFMFGTPVTPTPAPSAAVKE